MGETKYYFVNETGESKLINVGKLNAMSDTDYLQAKKHVLQNEQKRLMRKCETLMSLS